MKKIKKELTIPSKELKKEIFEYIFSEKVDHNACIKIWEENPWLAVSFYEEAVAPDNLFKPVCTPDGVVDNDGDVNMYAGIRAHAGRYNLDDGTIIDVDKFGRIPFNIDF